MHGRSLGLIAYDAKYDLEKLKAEWRPVAAVPMRREFAVLRGGVRFRRLPEREAGEFGVAITTMKAVKARRRTLDG